MQPLLFGTAERRLAGLYHPPARGVSQRAFLLCNPIGQEAIRAYRCYRELALRLSQADAHVLRFDYSGCGDSWGGANDCRVGTWLQDVRAAAVELMDTAAVRQLSVIGMRMGATLACLAAAQLARVDTMLLVDPVLDGQEYLAAARKAHAAMLEDPDRFPKPRRVGETNGELLGFEMPDSLLAEIGEIDLCTKQPVPAGRVEILATDSTADYGRFTTQLEQAGVSCRLTAVPCDARWDDGTALERTLIASDLVTAILDAAVPQTALHGRSAQ